MFSNINFLLVLSGCMMLGLGAGAMGCFALLRRRALLGDALAHAALPGICAAFMLSGTKDPFVLLAGASLSCWLGALAVDAIARWTPVKEDSALGIVLSVFFGVGILMLTHIQKTGAASQSGLDKFLFGQAAAMIERDVLALAVVSTALLLAMVAFFKEFKIVAFDPDFARTMGLPVRFIEIALATLIVLAVAAGLQTVGVVLMAAMLVTPAAAARYWTDRLSVMALLAAIFGAVSGAIGTIISLTADRMPTGPWMVVSVSLIFFVSLFLSPRRGLVAHLARLMRRRSQTAMENILRTLYRLGEAAGDWSAPRSTGDLLRYRPMPPSRLRSTLARLTRQGLIRLSADGAILLTEAGINRGARLTRMHRLWEVYLTRRVEIAPDHVHDDAEEIEHILTPELEERLAAALESPERDPHARRIPGSIANGKL